jgi:predicted small lipoprotein YifL
MKLPMLIVAALALALAACGKDGKAYCKKYGDKMADLGTAGMPQAQARDAYYSIQEGSVQRCKDGSISKQVAECVTAAADSTAAAHCATAGSAGK